MNSTTPAVPDQSHQMPTTVAIGTPAPAFTFAECSQQTPTVAETSPKRSARSTAKEVNYRELANGRSLRQKGDPNSTSREYNTARTRSSNNGPASGESGQSLSNSPELEDSGRSRELSTSDRTSEPATANGQRPTTGGKSTVLMAELKDNLSKLDVDKDRSSSLTPAPEDLEDLLPAVGELNGTTGDSKKAPGVNIHIKQYSDETPVPKIKLKATKNASVDVDTQIVDGFDATVRIHRLYG